MATESLHKQPPLVSVVTKTKPKKEHVPMSYCKKASGLSITEKSFTGVNRPRLVITDTNSKEGWIFAVEFHKLPLVTHIDVSSVDSKHETLIPKVNISKLLLESGYVENYGVFEVPKDIEDVFVYIFNDFVRVSREMAENNAMKDNDKLFQLVTSGMSASSSFFMFYGNTKLKNEYLNSQDPKRADLNEVKKVYDEMNARVYESIVYVLTLIVKHFLSLDKESFDYWENLRLNTDIQQP